MNKVKCIKKGTPKYCGQLLSVILMSQVQCLMDFQGYCGPERLLIC